MKTKLSTTLTFLLAAALWVALTGASRAQTPTNFSVTSPSFFFAISGTNDNPTLDLPAGATYTFVVDTTPGFHPFNILTEFDTQFPYTDNPYDGASPQNITSQTMTLVIPSTDYPATLFYECGIHAFGGQINVLPPLAVPAPPQNNIISIVLTPTSVTLKSSGTNTTYNLVPEFNSNLVSGVWQSIPANQFTNVFENGTNTTSFNRLEPVCGSNVFLRISQRPPQ